MNKSVSTNPSFSTHLLQSKQWQKYEELEGHQTIRLTGKNYAITAVLHETPFANYLFVPYGPSATTKTALLNALKALKRFSRQKNISFIRIEPTLALNASEINKFADKLGLKIKKSTNLDPQHTWHLDLTPEKDLLLKAMESNKARAWRNYQKKGMTIRTTKKPQEITILTNLLKKVSEADNFTPQNEKHLKNQLKSGFATLYIVELAEPKKSKTSNSSHHTADNASSGQKNNTPKKTTTTTIAAALIYDYDGTRYYAHAASDYEHRKLAAGSILLIQTIIDAKAAGQTTYDFWGITTSQDKNHPWYGFTQYKKSFGGHQVDYAGTYDLILRPLRYRIYSLFRSLNRTFRKLFKN